MVSDTLQLDYSQISPVLVKFLERYGFGPDTPVTLAGTAGSRRVYFRLAQGLRTFILLVSPSDDADFGRFLRITQFYRFMHFPVPMVYCIDDAAQQVLLEDLGDTRLYDRVHAPAGAPAAVSGGETTLALYRKVIHQLVDLQTRCFQWHRECPDISSRHFDEHDLLWETDYYATQYLRGHRGIDFAPAAQTELNAVFQELARRVNAQPKSIMHRDFQSQNLMIQFDGTVRVIDYQGSRLGSIYYDLASLLLDPYVMLSDSDIEELLRYYHATSLNPLAFDAMRHEFLLAAAQRIMQALGAYCFLSRVKGLPAFREHIEPGEQRLAWILKRVDWPALNSALPT